MKELLTCIVVTALLFCGRTSFGDTFGSGPNSFQIDFVTIGNPGNPPNTTGAPSPAGSVAYSYRIGKYEVSEQMIDKANALGALGIAKDTRGPDKPATSVTWLQAARFVNWLSTSTGSVPAYKFDTDGFFQLWQPLDPGYDATNPYRNKLAIYFLPSLDEWYKAAYYDPTTSTYFDYPTGSNVPPIAIASGNAPGTAVYNQSSPSDIMLAGGLSSYGTMAQGGNGGDELTEIKVPPSVLRGGSWTTSAGEVVDLSSSRLTYSPAPSQPIGSFRVGSNVPEPTTAVLVSPVCFMFFWVGTRNGAKNRFYVTQLVACRTQE